MPTPDRTSLDAIIAAARTQLEAGGLASVTMQAVAERVGVRAPSLYKRVGGRDDLLSLVGRATLLELADRLTAVEGARALADAMRAFAKERPAAFALIMTPGRATSAEGRELAPTVSAPVLDLATQLAGSEHALDAARTFTAWAAGFIAMELNGGFNLGGDVESAWDFGVTTLVRAMAADESSEPGVGRAT